MRMTLHKRMTATPLLAIVFLMGGAVLAQEQSKFTFALTERLRFVSWDNVIDLDDATNDQRSFTRHRTSLAFNYAPLPSLAFGAKLTNEFRYYFKPDDLDFEIHELIFDQLFVAWKRPAGLPLDMKLGRQNIILGEGFVIMDGHPLDGSRSIYFNGGRVDWHLSKTRTVTAFGVRQNRTDDFLPVINDQSQALIEHPEEGFGLYYSGQHGSHRLDAYFIRKNELGDAAHSAQIHATGLRGVFKLTSQWSLTSEGALQMGSRGNADLSAWGGYFHADYATNQRLPWPAKLTVGGIALSGDKRSTEKEEGWNPLFSRWPKWSESYIYAQIREFGGRVGYWSNFSSLYATLGFDLGQPVHLDLSLHKLGAMEPALPKIGSSWTPGTDRGLLFTAKMTARLQKQLNGHLIFERLCPGDYYPDTADAYNWFRFELLYSWRS